MSYIPERPFLLDVASGNIEGHGVATVWASNPAIGAVEETVWNDGGLYPWDSFATPQTLSISSSSQSDTAAGDGARTLIVRGLDASCTISEETVTLAGTGAVVTASEFGRVTELVVETAGASGANVGAIRAEIGATTVARIDAGTNTSIRGVATVPAGRQLYLVSAAIASTGLKPAVVRVFVRDPSVNNLFTSHIRFATDAGPLSHDFGFGDKALGPGADIDIRASQSGGGTQEISVALKVLMVDV